MMDLDAIKKRRESFDNAMREHSRELRECKLVDGDCGVCEACENMERVSNEFWGNLEGDEAALIEEVEQTAALYGRAVEAEALLAKANAALLMYEEKIREAGAQIAKLQRDHNNDQKTLHMFSSAQTALAEQVNQFSARADKAELDLRRFYECSDIEAFPREVRDGVCYDYGSVEVHAPTVWHRRPEE